MTATDLARAWDALPLGPRAALEQQWRALASGGLPCGAAIVDAAGAVVAVGHNRAYVAPGPLATRAALPLQGVRLAHAELNALALLPASTDHAALTLWTTQHPCAMCAAALAFVGVGAVGYVADDPSDHDTPARIAATRGAVPYLALSDPTWWAVANLLFLYNSAVQRGADAGNLAENRDRYPALVALALDLARPDPLGPAARAGTPLPAALAPHADAIARVAEGIGAAE